MDAMDPAAFPIMLPLDHVLIALLALIVSTAGVVEAWRYLARRRDRMRVPPARVITRLGDGVRASPRSRRTAQG
jgi:hypothetical protein